MSSKDDHHVDDQEKVLYISFNQDYGTFVFDTVHDVSTGGSKDVTSIFRDEV
jgi:hypothetical protein